MSKKNYFSEIKPNNNNKNPKNKKSLDNEPNRKTNKPKNKSTGWLEEAYDNSRNETAMWVAVITQAMMDALSRCKKVESIYQKHQAINWLTGNSKDFIDVCIAAAMNPDYVRRKAKQALAAPVA